MSNNDQDEKKEEEKSDDEFNPEELSEEEKNKKLEEFNAQRKHWKQKAQQSESEEDDSDSSQNSSTQDVDPNKINQLEEEVQQVKRSEKKRNFQHKHDLSPKQVDFLFRKSDGDPEDELDNPAMKAALDEIESQQKVEENTPSSSSKGFTTVTDEDEDFSELSDEEKQKRYEQRQKERGIM